MTQVQQLPEPLIEKRRLTAKQTLRADHAPVISADGSLKKDGPIAVDFGDSNSDEEVEERKLSHFTENEDLVGELPMPVKKAS